MKRHGFSGLGAPTVPTATTASPVPSVPAPRRSRVFKGTRMAGRMGNERHTTQSLVVHAVDAERGLILIKGAVPGPKGGLVLVRTVGQARPEGGVRMSTTLTVRDASGAESAARSSCRTRSSTCRSTSR